MEDLNPIRSETGFPVGISSGIVVINFHFIACSCGRTGESNADTRESHGKDYGKQNGNRAGGSGGLREHAYKTIPAVPRNNFVLA